MRTVGKHLHVARILADGRVSFPSNISVGLEIPAAGDLGIPESERGLYAAVSAPILNRSLRGNDWFIRRSIATARYKHVILDLVLVENTDFHGLQWLGDLRDFLENRETVLRIRALPPLELVLKFAGWESSSFAAWQKV